MKLQAAHVISNSFPMSPQYSGYIHSRDMMESPPGKKGFDIARNRRKQLSIQSLPSTIKPVARHITFVSSAYAVTIKLTPPTNPITGYSHHRHHALDSRAHSEFPIIHQPAHRPRAGSPRCVQELQTFLKRTGTTL